MGDAVDPHGQIRTTVQPCQIHKQHTPEPHVNHRHHIWPLGKGGPDTEDNIVVVCPSGHYNIHHLLVEFERHMGNVPYSILRRYAHNERRAAELGYKRMMRKQL